MKHYRGIFLIVDNTNNMEGRETNYDPQVYLMNKSIWKKYMNSVNDILCLFTCNDESLEFGQYKLDLDNNTLYVHGKETIVPGMTEKTLYSLIFLKEYFTFDYIIRTTLSAFFVLPKVNEFLSTLPKERVFRGLSPFGSFISGCAMYMSPDIVDILILNIFDIINIAKNENHYDDVLFSNILINNYSIQPVHDKLHSFYLNTIDNIDQEIKQLESEGIFQYRVKNPDDRMKYDTFILNKLYEYYYL